MEDIIVRAVERLRLAPGDIVIVTVPVDAEHHAVVNARAAFEHALNRAGHRNVPLLLKGADVELQVVSSADPDTDLTPAA